MAARPKNAGWCGAGQLIESLAGKFAQACRRSETIGSNTELGSLKTSLPYCDAAEIFCHQMSSTTIIKDLTVGEVAKFLSVSDNTVSKWCDTGFLKGYRIPGSLHRRFTPKDVMEFAQRHHVPVNPELTRLVSV